MNQVTTHQANAEPDMFGFVATQPAPSSACYQVEGTLQHDAEVRYLPRNDGVHTHALVLTLQSAETGGRIHAEQPFRPHEASQFEALATHLKRGTRVLLTAGLFDLSLHLPHVQQVTVIPTTSPLPPTSQ